MWFCFTKIPIDFRQVQYRQMLCKLSWAALGKLFILMINLLLVICTLGALGMFVIFAGALGVNEDNTEKRLWLL